MTLEVQHLVKQFGTTTVLDDISLSVGRGEILAVVGPSGAGKSTLARSISFQDPKVDQYLKTSNDKVLTEVLGPVPDPEAAKTAFSGEGS